MTESKTEENGSTELDKVKKRIIRQVEFYFGDYNLMRDSFMKEERKKDDGWFSMGTMLKFKRLASICSEPSTILEALKDADAGLLEIDAENNRIRRRPGREVPKDGEEYRTKLKARTVHVKGFQSEESIDDIHDFISEYGKLEGIQLLRTADKKFKGSIYATFFKREDAEKFVQAPMVYYKKQYELTKMSKSDHFKKLDEEKKDARKKKYEEKQKEGPDYLKGTVSLKVSGITDDTITHKEIKQVFESKGVKNIRFFDRIQKMGEEGYLIFEDTRSPEELLKVLEDNGGTKVTVKSADVEFSKPTDEEKTKYNKMYIEGRERCFSGRGSRKNQKFQRPGYGRKHKKPSPQKQEGKRVTFDSDEEDGGKQEAEANNEEPAAKVAKTD